MKTERMSREQWLDTFPTARERAQLRVMRWYWFVVSVLAVVPFPFLITAQLHGLHPQRGTWTFMAATLVPMTVFFITLIGCVFVWRFLSRTGEVATYSLCMFPALASGTARYEDDIFGDHLPMYAGWSVTVLLAVLAINAIAIRHFLPSPPRSEPDAVKTRILCIPAIAFSLAYSGGCMSLAPPRIPALWWVFGALCAFAIVVPAVLGIALRAWADNRRVVTQGWMQTTVMLTSMVCALPVAFLTYRGVYLANDLPDYPTMLTWGVVFFFWVTTAMGAMFLGLSFLIGITPRCEFEDEAEYEEEFGDDTEEVVEPVVHHPVPRVVTFRPSRKPQRSSRAEATARRRLRERAATIPGQEPTQDLLDELRSAVCVYCAAPASDADHIRPLARGGWNHELNLVASCAVCNTHSKNAKLIVEWAQERPELVLHGILTSPLVLAAYMSEVSVLETMHFRYPGSSDFVREACERRGRPDLIVKPRVSEVPLNRKPAEPSGLPFPPIVSDITHPDANAPKPRQWNAIGQRKAKGNRVETTFPDLTAAWKQWNPTALPTPVSKELELASA